MNDNEILFHLRNKLSECVAKAQAHFPNVTVPTPPITLRQMGRTAGRASWNYYFDGNIYTGNPDPASLRITINPDYCRNGNWDDMLNDTLPHEYAHILAIFIYGKRLGSGHGHGWKHCMRLLGLNPTRCHDYNMDGVKTKLHVKWEYKCSCDTHFVGKKIHEKIQIGGKRYTCKKCRQPVIYQKNFGKGIDRTQAS